MRQGNTVYIVFCIHKVFLLFFFSLFFSFFFLFPYFSYFLFPYFSHLFFYFIFDSISFLLCYKIHESYNVSSFTFSVFLTLPTQSLFLGSMDTMVCGVITRESCSEAFNIGITAEQVLPLFLFLFFVLFFSISFFIINILRYDYNIIFICY